MVLMGQAGIPKLLSGFKKAAVTGTVKGQLRQFSRKGLFGFMNGDYSKITQIPIYHGTSYLGDNFRHFAGKDYGLHVGTDSSPSIDVVKKLQQRSNAPAVIREGFLEQSPYTKRIKIDTDLSFWSPESFIGGHLAFGDAAPKILEAFPVRPNPMYMGGYDPTDMAKLKQDLLPNYTNEELLDFGKSYEISPKPTAYDPTGLDGLRNYLSSRNGTSRLRQVGDVFEYPNHFEGSTKAPSLLITDPNSFKFAPHRWYTPPKHTNGPTFILESLRKGGMFNKLK